MLKKLLDSRRQPIQVPTRASSLKRKSNDLFMSSSSMSSFGLKKQQQSKLLFKSTNNSQNNNFKVYKSKNLFKHDTIRDLVIKTQNSSKQNQKSEQINKNQLFTYDSVQLTQKLQNVSCLYSNFLYRNDQKQAFESIKAERFRLMAINQRQQKNLVMKVLQETKLKLTLKLKQNQTILFAYRTLQSKFKQKQQYNRHRLQQLQKQNQKLLKNYNPVLSESKNNKRQSKYKTNFQNSQSFLTPSQTQLIKNSYNLNNMNSISQQEQVQVKQQQGYDILDNTIYRQRLQELEQIIQNKQSQIQQIQQKYNKLDRNHNELTTNNSKLSKQSQNMKTLIYQFTQKIAQLQQTNCKNHQIINNIRSQFDYLQTKYNQISLQYVDRQKQAQRQQQIIKDLEQTKYSYLMKEQRQRQQVQLLKKFTLSLKLNDSKINEFIRDTFGNQVSDGVSTGHKSYKEDLSYILHLVKKKQNIYNEFIKQYQQKLRQTETRCFLLQKKMHINDIFIKKLDQMVNQTKSINNTKKQKQKQNNNKKQKQNNNKKQQQTQNNRNIQNGISIIAITKLIENYKLDKRSI